MTAATAETSQETNSKQSEKKGTVRNGRRFRKSLVDEHYDVIVVGSGIGGLANAALLSLLGKKVCVLEQHYTAGGFTHAYRRKGYEWDVGVHYIGEVHKKYSSLRRIFDVISDSRLKWAEMDPIYDKIVLGDEEYDFVAGKDNFIENLVKRFPEDENAIKQYVKLIRKISKESAKYFAGQALPLWMAKIYNYFRPRLVSKEFFLTTREVLEGLTANQQLISVLTGQWGDYGHVPKESAFLMHALLAKHYLAGAAYPVGGASSIAREIIPTILKSGGGVFTDAQVDEILVKDNTAYGVRVADGTEITADKVVSNIGFVQTMQQLLPQSSQDQHRTTNWMKDVSVSSSSICLYAGFKGDSKELNLHSTNLWLYPNSDHEGNVERFQNTNKDDINAELPLVYISFPSTKDPQWSTHFPNKSTVEIVSITHSHWFEQWKETQWNKRGDEYLAYKEVLSQKLLHKLFEREPQLRDKLDYYELSTPLSTQFYQRNVEGEIYGLDHKVERFNKSFLHPQTPINNLFLTGADIMTAGVGGALMGGVMTTMRMQGLRKMSQVTALFKNYEYNSK
ncbi:NAD(P)/FAD-dependent oxidoreductase [Thalassotalea psychrophila]|uniref:NAD(P)/FAD-dependent oxidoreductase n=1 Tax=Thalassotalea psychrophila TaxID=3065647 RepID=A0ABY9TQG5_9GAMM|nr:NAD(P)/FAD-dependent oxidoreductase [Colwelliaceae bacterium SQ149]